MNGLMVGGILLSIAGYLGLATWAWRVRRDHHLPYRRATVLACLATVGWAGTGGLGLIWPGGLPPTVPLFADLIRCFAWIHLLSSLRDRIEDSDATLERRLVGGRVLLVGGLLLAALTIVVSLAEITALSNVLLPLILALMVLLEVAGLALSERVYKASDSAGRWGLKHLILGLVTLFAFDLYLYADALMLREVPVGMAAAHGLVMTLICPLLALSIARMKSWTPPGGQKRAVSGMAALQGVAVLGSGIYLLVMATVAFVVREAGGEWGSTMQITLLIAALLAMAVALGSARFTSRARIYIQKTFFTYKYEYREEWRRFIAMMSAHQPLTLGERIIRAIANIMDSPAGALWIYHRADDAFVPDAAWNYHGPRPLEPADSPFVTFLRRTGWMIETGAPPEPGEPPPPLPQWITDNPHAWLTTPLIHRGEVLGILVLDQARARRRLDWEDRDLLKTVTAQAASYMAEEQAAEALREAQQFEDFNRRFAFVAHDIKTVVGQMTLMMENVAHFGDNPEFQKDMLQTVQNSTKRLKSLLDQLAEKRRRPENVSARLDARAVVAAVAERWRKVCPSVSSALPSDPAFVSGSEDNLVAVLDLLIDNAVQAQGPSGSVLVSLLPAPRESVIEIRDDGPGMDPDFVRTELFRPLRSTKGAGYGIGAYQTRHLVSEMGGRLEVDTAPAQGTTMRILLPTAAPEADRSEAFS